MSPALPRPFARLSVYLRVALLPVWLFALAGCAPEPPRELMLLGQPGPWPWVSDLVGYGERLWLANSVKHREHNSADLYSFDQATATVA